MSKSKHILLIGGRSGIGQSYRNLMLEDENVHITICGRTEVLFSDNKDRLNFIKVDLLDKLKRNIIVETAVEKFGDIDHLVFCQRNRKNLDVIFDEFEIMVTATADIIDRATANFDTSGSRSIVILNSTVSNFATKQTPMAYQLVRGAVDQLVRYFALKLGPKNIRVNCVSTCTIQKPENAKYFETTGKMKANLQREITPRHYFGTSRDVSKIIKFLASDSANLINGQTLVADGGATIQAPEDIKLK